MREVGGQFRRCYNEWRQFQPKTGLRPHRLNPLKALANAGLPCIEGDLRNGLDGPFALALTGLVRDMRLDMCHRLPIASSLLCSGSMSVGSGGSLMLDRSASGWLDMNCLRASNASCDAIRESSLSFSSSSSRAHLCLSFWTSSVSETSWVWVPESDRGAGGATRDVWG